MSNDQLGGPQHASGDPYALKRALHRFAIDAIEDSGRNLLEAPGQR